MINKILILIFVETILFVNISFNQEKKVVKDFGLWTELNLEKKIFKKFELNISQQFRFFKNVSSLDDYIAEIGLGYSIDKHFGLGGSARYIFDRKYNCLEENNFRYKLDINYKTKLSSSFCISYFLAYQKEFIDYDKIEFSLNQYKSYIRNKITLKYKRKTQNYYVTGEVFRILKKCRDPYFNKYRIFIGDEHKFAFGNIDIALGLEHELNSINPYNYYLLRFKYTFKLK